VAEKKGFPDFQEAVLIQGQDRRGKPVTVLLDEEGRIIAILTGQFAGQLRTITTDEEGRLVAVLYGTYGSTRVPIQVTSDGRLVFARLDQGEVAADTVEAQTWDPDLYSLVNNLNRIRNMIVRLTGRPWGTVEKAVPDYFHGTDGHKHLGVDGEGPKLGNASLLADIDASKIASGRFPLARLPDGPAGYVLTAQGTGNDPTWQPAPTPVYRHKTADEFVYNSNVLQNDDHLYFSAGANQIWLVQYHLLVDTPYEVGIKFLVSAPSGSSGWYAFMHLGVTNYYRSIGSGITLDWSLEYINAYMHIVALVITGSTAGTIQLQWAQYTATRQYTYVKANSILVAQRLA